MSLFNELKRRNVFRVGLAYLVSAWVIAQVASLVLSSITAPPWVMQVILLVLGLGFVIALIISWAYELTPEGLKKDADVSSSESIAHHTAKKLDYITIIAAVTVLGLFVYQQMNPVSLKTTVAETISNSTDQPSAAIESPTVIIDGEIVLTETNSIAVLPFVNMSSDAEQEYFADGISEEILNALVKATGLRVAGRTSSFSFKGKDDTIKEIGEALNVAHVLEGSVRKQGNNVRITAQLIKTDDEFHLWSETYDGSLDNIFDLQESISRQVTDELKVILNLNAGERLANKMTENIDAYDLFLRGREAVGKRLDDNLEKGMGLLHQAVELDPGFAMAWAVIAEAEAVSPGYVTQTPDEAMASKNRAIKYAQKSISLDGQLALPHAVLGLLNLFNDEPLQGIDELKQALHLEPNNPLSIRWLGVTYGAIGRTDLAMPLYEKAYTLDPLSSINTFNLAAGHFTLKHFEEAIRFYRITGELRGRMMPQISFVYSQQGKHDEAKDWIREMLKDQYVQGNRSRFDSKENLETMILGMFGANEAEKAAAKALGGTLVAGKDDQAVWQLEYLLASGNIDRVFEILANKPSFFTSFAEDVTWLPHQGVQDFRQDPRFIQLMIEHNYPETWQAIGWPVHCQPDAGTDGSDGQFQCQ